MSKIVVPNVIYGLLEVSRQDYPLASGNGIIAVFNRLLSEALISHNGSIDTFLESYDLTTADITNACINGYQREYVPTINDIIKEIGTNDISIVEDVYFDNNTHKVIIDGIWYPASKFELVCSARDRRDI